MANRMGKGVRTQHADYLSAQDRWSRCRDAAAGQDAIRAGGPRYLPRLGDQPLEAYDAYLTRANWFNATSRTIEGLKGMLFRKPEQLDVPEAILPLLDDVTMAGEPLHMFSQKIAQEVLTVGRVGVMVDHPSPPKQTVPLTVQRAQRLGLRPKLALYCAESIWNWQCSRINNTYQLSQVVLHEKAPIPGADEFDVALDDRWRVLDLLPTATGYVYRQRLFMVNRDTDEDVLLEEVFPQLNGQTLSEIPFSFIGVETNLPDVEIPPLIDVVDVNLSHFRVSADYEHGCHFTGLPTPFIAGYTPMVAGEKFHVGSLTAFVFPDADTKCGYLEFTGQGLTSLVENLQGKKDNLAALGARLLSGDPGTNQTALTAAIHQGGETSILAAIAQSISLGLQRMLTLFTAWAGLTVDIGYSVNRSFYPLPMDAQKLSALVAAWQNGALSAESLYFNLQVGELIPDDTTFEEEQALIEAERIKREQEAQAKAEADAALQVQTAQATGKMVPNQGVPPA